MRSIDAVLLAKDFHSQLDPFRIPITIESIKSYLYSGGKVEIRSFLRVSWQPKLIFGRIRRYYEGDKTIADIVISDSLNACWTRFVACKELGHIFSVRCGEDEAGPLEEIRSAMEPFTAIGNDMPPEKWAILAAIELLIPWQTRATIQNMLQEGKTNYQIALYYRVPERIIDLWRSPHYQEKIAELWDGMEEHHERLPPQI